MTDTPSRIVYDALITKWKTKAEADISATVVEIAQGIYNTLNTIFDDPKYALLTMCIVSSGIIRESEKKTNHEDAVLRVAVTIKDLLGHIERTPLH